MTRILVVDDNQQDAAQAARLLSAISDSQVVVVDSGERALTLIADDQFDNNHFDVVLTDLHMPEMDGIAVLKAVHAQRPILPVIVMTSRGNEIKAVQALEAGAASYLPKSRLDTDLLTTFKRVLASATHSRDHAILMNHLVHEHFELEVENDRGRLPALVDYIVGRCVQFDVAGDAMYPRIGVAIEEAVVNAMVHGNLEVSSELREESYELYEERVAERMTQPYFSDRRVTVIGELSRGYCRVVIRDEGSGFRPEELRDPTDPANLSRVSGRGILLMRAFLDDVTYNNRGNEVTLTVGSPKVEEAFNPLVDFGLTTAVSTAG